MLRRVSKAWTTALCKTLKISAGPQKTQDDPAKKPEPVIDRSRMVKLVFIDKDQKRFPVEAPVGMNILDVGRENGLPIEGACEASLACCTCHVYLDPKFLHLFQTPGKKEEDLLDMAPFLKDTSRLGCQIIVKPEMEGMEISLPPATRNFYVDNKVPEHH